MDKSTTSTGITTVVRHFIKADKRGAFENWTKDISAKAKQFEGFEGLQLIPPPSGSKEYITLFKFSSVPALQKWMDSDERKNEVSKLNSLSEKEMVLGQIEGVDFWFDAPGKKTDGAPPKWKMSLLTWLAVFPGVVILGKLYHALFPDFSSILLTLFTTMTLVPLLTWVLMPNIVKLFKGWLFGKK